MYTAITIVRLTPQGYSALRLVNTPHYFYENNKVCLATVIR